MPNAHTLKIERLEQQRQELLRHRRLARSYGGTGKGLLASIAKVEAQIAALKRFPPKPVA